MHGVAVPQALVPAIKLAAEPDILCKRVGQLATRCLLAPDNLSLLLLLQNTLHRDLCSRDDAVVATALHTVSRLADGAMCAALAPVVEAVLERDAYEAPASLRAKAVSALARCWQLGPVAEGEEARRVERLRGMLTERSPAVLSAVLGALAYARRPVLVRSAHHPAAEQVASDAVARALLPELVAAQAGLLEAAVAGGAGGARPGAGAWVQVQLLNLIRRAYGAAATDASLGPRAGEWPGGGGGVRAGGGGAARPRAAGDARADRQQPAGRCAPRANRTLDPRDTRAAPRPDRETDMARSRRVPCSGGGRHAADARASRALPRAPFPLVPWPLPRPSFSPPPSFKLAQLPSAPQPSPRPRRSRAQRTRCCRRSRAQPSAWCTPRSPTASTAA